MGPCGSKDSNKQQKEDEASHSTCSGPNTAIPHPMAVELGFLICSKEMTPLLLLSLGSYEDHLR
jgi:hypothetical protein